MHERFALRFESGERRGESISISPTGLTVGRRPENDLVLAEASVSGEHAVLRFERGGLWVEDLGSTNGTRVAGRGVVKTELAPGDRIAFGKLEFEVVLLAEGETSSSGVGDDAARPDRDLGGGRRAEAPRPMPARPVAPSASAAGTASKGRAAAPSRGVPDLGEELELELPSGAAAPPEGEQGADTRVEVALERLAAAEGRGRRSAFWLLALLLVAGAAAGTGWYVTRGDETASGPQRAAPVPAPGDLLGADFSFEAPRGQEGWDVDLGGVSLERDRLFARSGQYGLGLEADAGERGLAVSSPVEVRPGQSVHAAVHAFAAGPLAARLGLRFEGEPRGDGAEPLSVDLFGPRVAGGDGFERLEFAASVPAGFDRARVLLAAGDGEGGRVAGSADADAGDGALLGAAGFDDAALWLEAGGEAAEASLRLGDFRLDHVGGQVLLSRFDRLLLVLRLGAPRAGGDRAAAALAADSALELGRDGEHARLAWNVGAPARLELMAAPGWHERALASLGAAGYQAHTARFEADAVGAVLIGDDLEMVRLGFDPPRELLGTAESGWAVLSADIAPGPGALAVQVSFAAERAEAQRLAGAARSADEGGRTAESLAAWSDLLERFPFEVALVHEAEVARAWALARGLDELRRAEREAERARFFALAELFERTAASARELAVRYRGTDVEPRALALSEELAQEARELERAGRARREEVLTAMLAHLEEVEAASLAQRVRDSLRAEEQR